MWHHVVSWSVLMIVSAGGIASAQDAPPPPPVSAPSRPDSPDERVRVYLDCNNGGLTSDQCFSTCLRDRITFVDFVRQAQDAEVHVLANGQETGGGGREVVLLWSDEAGFSGTTTT